MHIQSALEKPQIGSHRDIVIYPNTIIINCILQCHHIKPKIILKITVLTSTQTLKRNNKQNYKL